MQSFESILDQKLQKVAGRSEKKDSMYTNFEVTNIKSKEDAEIEGEIMLMHVHDYIPSARSAIANLAKRAEKFICHFEVWTDKELYIAEAASENIKLCIQLVEKKMLQKLGLSGLGHTPKLRLI